MRYETAPTTPWREYYPKSSTITKTRCGRGASFPNTCHKHPKKSAAIRQRHFYARLALCVHNKTQAKSCVCPTSYGISKHASKNTKDDSPMMNFIYVLPRPIHGSRLSRHSTTVFILNCSICSQDLDDWRDGSMSHTILGYPPCPTVGFVVAKLPQYKNRIMYVIKKGLIVFLKFCRKSLFKNL